MKFKDMEMGYNESLDNSSRVRILSPVEETPMVVVNNNNNNDSIFKECLKNHAVSHGGHALDGCGEFLPAGPEGSLNALKFTVCNCHRNFHRKETTLPPNFVSIGIVPATVIPVGDAYPLYNHHHHHAPPPSQYVVYPYALAPILEPGNGDGGEDHGDVIDIDNGGGGSSSNSKKRFRTKFTAEEKGKMSAFPERMD